MEGGPGIQSLVCLLLRERREEESQCEVNESRAGRREGGTHLHCPVEL
jgi:hypothetical protein